MFASIKAGGHFEQKRSTGEKSPRKALFRERKKNLTRAEIARDERLATFTRRRKRRQNIDRELFERVQIVPVAISRVLIKRCVDYVHVPLVPISPTSCTGSRRPFRPSLCRRLGRDHRLDLCRLCRHRVRVGRLCRRRDRSREKILLCQILQPSCFLFFSLVPCVCAFKAQRKSEEEREKKIGN